MGIDHSILVTMLDPLELDGLVKRERDVADRRRHVVTAHPGRQAPPRRGRLSQAHREAEDALLTALAAHQRDELRDLLITLRDANVRRVDGADRHTASDDHDGE